MNENPREDGSSGRLSRAATKCVGPLAVDCTAWETNIPAEKWSSGKLVSVTQSQPAVEGAFIPAGSLELELALQIDPAVKPDRAFAVAAHLVASVFACDPGLGLTHDPTRSRTRDGQVVIVLTASRPGPDAEVRLERIAEVIRKRAGEAGGIALSGVRVRRAA